MDFHFEGLETAESPKNISSNFYFPRGQTQIPREQWRFHFSEYHTAFVLSTPTNHKHWTHYTPMVETSWSQVPTASAQNRTSFHFPSFGQKLPFISQVCGFFLLHYKREWTESPYLMAERDENTASHQTPSQRMDCWREVRWADVTSGPRSAGLWVDLVFHYALLPLFQANLWFKKKKKVPPPVKPLQH